MGASAVSTELQIPLLTRISREGGTCIDRLLHTDRHNNILCVGAFTVQGSLWMTISDHSPIWGHYVLPVVHDSINTPLVTVAQREFVELPLNDKEIGKRFAEDMDTWLSMRQYGRMDLKLARSFTDYQLCPRASPSV